MLTYFIVNTIACQAYVGISIVRYSPSQQTLTHNEFATLFCAKDFIKWSNLLKTLTLHKFSAYKHTTIDPSRDGADTQAITNKSNCFRPFLWKTLC